MTQTASLAHPTFDPGFTAWLETAPMDELEDSYAEQYKYAHGIKARWVCGRGYSRQQFADMFVSLGINMQEEEKREAEAEAWYAEQDAYIKSIKAEADSYYDRMYVSGMLTPAEAMAGRVGYEDQL